jgi:hypothetical protein
MSPNFIESSDQIVWKIIPNQFIYEKILVTQWAGNCVPKCNPISNFDKSTQFPISLQAQTKYLLFSIQYFVLCNNL